VPDSGQAANTEEYRRALLTLCLGVVLGLIGLAILFGLCRSLYAPNIDVKGLTGGFGLFVTLFLSVASALFPPLLQVGSKVKTPDDKVKQALAGAFCAKPYLNKHLGLPPKLKTAFHAWYALLLALVVLAGFCYMRILLASLDIGKVRGFWGGSGIAVIVLVECFFWHVADRFIRECEANPHLAQAIGSIETTGKQILLNVIQDDLKDVEASARANVQIIDAACLAWDTYENKSKALEVLESCMKPFLDKYYEQEEAKRGHPFKSYCEPLYRNLSAKVCPALKNDRDRGMICQMCNGSCPVLDTRKNDFNGFSGACPYQNIVTPKFYLGAGTVASTVSDAWRNLTCDTELLKWDSIEGFLDKLEKLQPPPGRPPEPPPAMAITIPQETAVPGETISKPQERSFEP